MTVAIAPSVEACTAIVDRINSGTLYELDIVAERFGNTIDPLEEVTSLRVDVVHESEEQLVETLDIEDRTSHDIRVWIRAKVADATPDSLDPLRLVVRQIYQRLNDFDSADGRVKVWEINSEQREIPEKDILHEHWLFVTSLTLRVEVEAS